MRRALAIVGKAPRAGQAKTRLVPTLSVAEAAELAGAFLLDTVALGLSLGWESVCVAHPAEDGARLQALLPPAVRLYPQQQPGLGAALREAFEYCFEHGHDRVVIVDSDSPTLPPRVLEDACTGLDEHDVTIGPSADGGYYLLGLRQRHAELFDGIAWSTPSVYAETLRHAQNMNLNVLSLQGWYDVDVPEDLERLTADLAQQPPPTAPHTRAVLERLRPGAAE